MGGGGEQWRSQPQPDARAHIFSKQLVVQVITITPVYIATLRAFINICCFEKVHSTTKLMHDLFYALYGLYREAYMAYLLPKRSINNLLHLSAHGA